jgi:hypothetical protein
MFVDDSPTTQTLGNLELPSGTHFPSDLLISIFLLLCAKGFNQLCLEQKKYASIYDHISHYISFETLPHPYKAFATSLHSNFVSSDWRGAMQDPKWKKLMFEEMRALVKNDI